MKKAECDFIKMLEATDLFMRYVGLEVDSNGYIYYYNDDNDTITQLYLDGMKCVYPKFEVKDPKLEIALDVYNNPKQCAQILYFYNNNILGYQIDMMFLTNSKSDTMGRLEVRYINGTVYDSNVYFKDTLKYIDMVMKMEQAVPMDFTRLRELDLRPLPSTTDKNIEG